MTAKKLVASITMHISDSRKNGSRQDYFIQNVRPSFYLMISIWITMNLQVQEMRMAVSIQAQNFDQNETEKNGVGNDIDSVKLGTESVTK